MAGSTSALLIIPIVVVIVLAAWIALVFYADAHPVWQRGASSSERSTNDRAARVAAGRLDERPDTVPAPEAPQAGRDTEAERPAETARARASAA